MLIEIWERLRGYHKWIETQATIKSCSLEDLGVGPVRGDKSCRLGLYDQWQSKCEISWVDASGTGQTASYAVSERSSLFNLYEGQTVPIRYNPVRSSEYYVRDLFRHRASFILLSVVALLFYGAMVVIFSLEILRRFH
jgi:hypothetical protein